MENCNFDSTYNDDVNLEDILNDKALEAELYALVGEKVPSALGDKIKKDTAVDDTSTRKEPVAVSQSLVELDDSDGIAHSNKSSSGDVNTEADQQEEKETQDADENMENDEELLNDPELMKEMQALEASIAGVKLEFQENGNNNMSENEK